jgi:glucokinase
VSDLAVGIDVGGTKLAGGVVDTEGRVVARRRVRSPTSDPDAMVATIEELFGELTRDHQVSYVGVAAAGFVDEQRAMVRYAPNLVWEDVPLRASLERVLDLPVVVENDANAAAWGEYRFGAGSQVRHLLMVTVGTGVGGGVVIDDQLLRGGFGSAMEVGHVRVVPGGLVCGCGRRGCWEQYASGSALVRETWARAVAEPDAAASLLARAGGKVKKLTGPMVTAAAQDGDPFATARLAELGRWLGEGLSSLVAVLDPQLIAIGGGVADAGELLLGPAREAFVETLTAADQRPRPELRLASLGNDAGMIGAGDLARLR